jgi:uncharacterized protein YcgL (UPF0745 family)
MKADVYRTNKKSTYLLMPHGTPFSAAPQAVLDQCGTLQFWKAVELQPGMVAANSEEIEADLKNLGYSIRATEINFKIST